MLPVEILTTGAFEKGLKFVEMYCKMLRMSFEGKIDKNKLRKAIVGGGDPDLVREAGRRGGVAAGRKRHAEVARKAAQAREHDSVFAQIREEEMQRGALRAAYERGDHLLPDL